MNIKGSSFIIWLIFTLTFLSCSKDDFTLTIRNPFPIPPLPPQSVLLSSNITTNPRATPWIKWGEGADFSGTGLLSYEYSVGSSQCGFDIIPWTDTNTLYPGNSLTKRFGSFIVPLATPLVQGQDYYVNVRTRDNYNQFSEPVCNLFNYSSTGWKQEAYVKAINSEMNDAFGNSVAFDGDTMVVGALNESSNQTSITNGATANSSNLSQQSGAAYVYRKVSGIWQQEAYLKASNADAGDSFGARVAISGDTIAVSAPNEASSETTITHGGGASPDNSSLFTGAVYIFQRTGNTWTQQAYIKASNAGFLDQFGAAIAIHNDTLVVGAPSEGSDLLTITNGPIAPNQNGRTQSGAVYVYTRTAGVWSQQSYIKAPNADSSDFFGDVVAVENDTIAVTSYQESSDQNFITNGAGGSLNNDFDSSGAVYIFTRSFGNWSQQAYIKSSRTQSLANFGGSISLSGDTLAAGATFQSTNVNSSGAAFVFKRTGINWTEEAFIEATNAGSLHNFGSSVSLRGDKLAIGAPGESSVVNTIINTSLIPEDSQSENSGAVYIYSRSGVTWSRESYIKPTNLQLGNSFGNWVALSATGLCVGAASEPSLSNALINGPLADQTINADAPSSGAVYIYAP